MKDNDLIKAVGIIATIIGLGATLMTEWVNDKKIDEKIEWKINEALAKKEEDKEF